MEEVKHMATKKEIRFMKDTVRIMKNQETLKQVADSIEDIKQGRVKEVHSVRDLLNAM